MSLTCELGPVEGEQVEGGVSAHLQLINEHRDRIELVVLVLTLHRWMWYVY